jgi:hypothetical protein
MVAAVAPPERTAVARRCPTRLPCRSLDVTACKYNQIDKARYVNGGNSGPPVNWALRWQRTVLKRPLTTRRMSCDKHLYVKLRKPAFGALKPTRRYARTGNPSAGDQCWKPVMWASFQENSNTVLQTQLGHIVRRLRTAVSVSLTATTSSSNQRQQ